MKWKICRIILVFFIVSIIAGCEKSNGNRETSDKEVLDNKDTAHDTVDKKDDIEQVSGLSYVTTYPNMDERILFGSYEYEKWYLSKFGDVSPDEKDKLYEQYQAELHFSNVEISDYVSTKMY